MLIQSTERLILREPRKSDIEGYFVIRNSDAFLEFNPMPAASKDEAMEELSRMIAEKCVWFIYLQDTNALIGMMEFHPDYMRYGVNASMISYNLHPGYTGHGYMTEALRGMLKFLFTMMGKEVVSARVFAGNDDSVRLLERLGFSCEGTLRKGVRGPDKVAHDDLLFSILREEWMR